MSRSGGRGELVVPIESLTVKESPSHELGACQMNSNGTLRVVEELAGLIHQKWGAGGRESGVFPDIAASSLAQFSSRLIESAPAVVDSVLQRTELSPAFVPHNAGEVVTLYSHVDFDIVAHLHTDGLAGPHHHRWSGAYQIISGLGMAAGYSFRETNAIRGGFRIGTIKPVRVDVLAPGQTKAIYPGTRTIHAVCNPERPTMAVRVRSRAVVGTTMEYHRPGVCAAMAENGDLANDLEVLHLRCLRFLAALDVDRFWSAIDRLISTGTVPGSYFALREAAAQFGDIPPHIVESVHRRHGGLADTLLASCADQLRFTQAMRLRRANRNEDLRYFISALYLCETREEILDVIRRRVPADQSRQKLGEWLACLLAGGDDMVATGSGMSETFKEAMVLLTEGKSMDDAAVFLRQRGAEQEISEHDEFLRDVATELRSVPFWAPLLK